MENIFCFKKGKEKVIDILVVKLCVKYKWLKEQWRRFIDRVKFGSGKLVIDEFEWFIIIDLIFFEIYIELKVVMKVVDIFVSDGSSEGDEYSEKEEDIEEMKFVISMVFCERRQLLDFSIFFLDVSFELSYLLGNESEEEYNR